MTLTLYVSVGWIKISSHPNHVLSQVFPPVGGEKHFKLYKCHHAQHSVEVMEDGVEVTVYIFALTSVHRHFQ